MIYIDNYPFDVSISETHSFQSNVTDKPVESGSNISDNIRNLPAEVTIQSAVSDTPSGAIESNPTRAGASVGQGGAPGSPSDAAYNKLLAIRNARKPVTIITSRRTYTSMALTSLSEPVDVQSSGGMLFTATFKQIKIVTNQRTTTKVSRAVPRAAGQQSRGTVAVAFLATKTVTWRHGKPPGTSLETTPPGVITKIETLQITDSLGFAHANGQPLTAQEMADFRKDWMRDQALAETQAATAIQDRLGFDRGTALASFKNAHPGQFVDPKIFGLD